MTGTVRKLRSRNPYREVLRTYRRWRFFGVVVSIVPTPGLFLALHEHASRIADFVPVIFAAMPFSSLLASHLRELLGSPRARVTPGLCRAHFVVAGAWIAIFAVFVPFVFSLFFVQGNGPRFTLVALSFATFAVTCFLLQASGVTWLLITLWCLSGKLHGLHFIRSLSWFESAALFAMSLLLLTRAAVSVAHFDAEDTLSMEWRFLQRAGRFTAQVIYFVRLQFDRCGFVVRGALAGRRDAVDADRRKQPRQFDASRRISSRRLRSLGGSAPGPGESLWRRAGHWNAAWRISGKSTLSGAIIGGTLIAYALRRDPAVFYGWAVLGALLPIVALVFGVSVVDREQRARLTLEFLRPFSREQFVQAVGLATMVALARFILLAVAVPGIVFWLRGDLSRTGNVLWFAVAVMTWLPVFLAIALANLPSFETNSLVILWLVLYGIFVVICAANSDSIEPYPMSLLCGILLTIDLLSLRGAYRSWLSREPEEGRIP